MAQFTKQAIVASFVKLLGQKPLDKITVKDVVEDCGVNRNTFYYYFQDIYALLDEVFQEETRAVLEEGQPFTSWQEGVLHAITFARENKKAIYHIYNSMGRERLRTYLDDVIAKVALEYVQQEARGLNVCQEDIELLAEFYKHALSGMVIEWIRRDMTNEAEPMILNLARLSEGALRAMLEKNGRRNSDAPGEMPKN